MDKHKLKPEYQAVFDQVMESHLIHESGKLVIYNKWLEESINAQF